MKIIICPHCLQEIKLENNSSYYSRHREEILEKYKKGIKDPEYVKRRRAIALKSYHKRKKLKNG